MHCLIEQAPLSMKPYYKHGKAGAPEAAAVQHDVEALRNPRCSGRWRSHAGIDHGLLRPCLEAVPRRVPEQGRQEEHVQGREGRVEENNQCQTEGVPGFLESVAE